MTRRDALLAVAAGVGLGTGALAAERVPFAEIVDRVQLLAAEHLGRRKSDVSTVDSLFAQGMRESTFDALLVAIQDEFGVVIPGDEIRRAKFDDAATGISVRRLAELVEKHMRAPM